MSGLFFCTPVGSFFIVCNVRRTSALVLRAGKEDISMKLDLFDDMDGLILHERENSLGAMEMKVNITNKGQDNVSRFPASTPLAMAYVPYQQWGETYGDDEALSRGTLFPELDLPFSGGGDSR